MAAIAGLTTRLCRRTFKASISPFLALRKLLNAFPFFPRNSEREGPHMWIGLARASPQLNPTLVVAATSSRSATHRMPVDLCKTLVCIGEIYRFKQHG